MSKPTFFTDHTPAQWGVEHYTDTLSKQVDCPSRLRWLLAEALAANRQVKVLGIEMPLPLLRETLQFIDEECAQKLALMRALADLSEAARHLAYDTVCTDDDEAPWNELRAALRRAQDALRQAHEEVTP